jgi:hypothetical protein
MIQQTEFYSTEEQCYILIHKNACSSIRANLLKEFEGAVVEGTASEGIRWTVVRDPYTRFIDAISYDIRRQKVLVTWEDTSIKEYLKTIDMSNYISNHISHTFTSLGLAPHSVLQTIYLFDNNVDVIVYAKDLKHFIPIHFKNPVAPQNMGEPTHQDIVYKAIEELPVLKKEILGLLNVDYIMLEHMRTQGKVWTWGCGKIW